MAPRCGAGVCCSSTVRAASLGPLPWAVSGDAVGGKNAETGGIIRGDDWRIKVDIVTKFGEWLHFVFSGDVPDEPLKLHHAMARAVVVYLAGLVVIRLGKSRSIGKMTPLDV